MRLYTEGKADKDVLNTYLDNNGKDTAQGKIKVEVSLGKLTGPSAYTLHSNPTPETEDTNGLL